MNSARINEIMKSIKEDLQKIKEAEQDIHIMQLIPLTNSSIQQKGDPQQRIKELQRSIRQHVYQLKEEVES